MRRREYKGSKNPNYRGGFEQKCSQCNKPAWVKPSRAGDLRHFCSTACRNVWVSENTRGQNHWRWQGGPAERECGRCGIKFWQRRSEFNKAPAKYCSQKCSAEARQRRVSKTCELCGQAFETVAHKASARFCSQACKKLSQVKHRTEMEVARRTLNNRISALMSYSLKGRKARCKWESLVGYTLAELMKHLEERFQPGMTWENIGEWHIDHIMPRSAFSYSEPSDPQFLACWAKENLQPLWKLDNLRKGSKTPVLKES